MEEKYRHPFVKRRKLLGYTQEDIADVAGVRARAVQTWESGRHQPKLKPQQFADLCDFLKCTIQELAADFAEIEREQANN